MPETAAPARSSGLVLGRYRPLRPLGSGGSGSVWLAHDESAGIDVALKVVRREGKAGARAEREAEAAARLRHERCLRAYHLDADDRHVYIAYEYVPGRTLREALRTGEVDDAAAVEAAAQVLEGLAHAHARGIVHRDVKPANVLLADGEDVSVRLLDFGLAAMEEAETLTALGDVPGTLAYIAPERLQGAPATAASDVWAVGVMLWEALAGVHPFWKPSLLASARAIESGAPALASARPDLPKPLLAAVDRALAADPARRPTAAKLAGALRDAMRRPSGRRTEAPDSPTSRSPSRLAAAGLAAVFAGGGASLLPFYPPGFAPALAALAGGLALVRPRAGLALALAVPVFPLGNVALALALAYVGVAVVWLALFWREPDWALLPAAGPLLAPLAALGLLPLLAQPIRSPLRRAAASGAGLLAAVAVAGIRAQPLPVTEEPPPAGLAVAGSERPHEAATAVADVLAARPALLALAAAVAAGAALVPYARASGAVGIAAWGALFLAAMLVPAPDAAALSLVLAVWASCAVLWTLDARAADGRAIAPPAPPRVGPRTSGARQAES